MIKRIAVIWDVMVVQQKVLTLRRNLMSETLTMKA